MRKSMDRIWARLSVGNRHSLNSELYCLALLILVLVLAIGHRLVIVTPHFTHADDIGVASVVLSAKARSLNAKELVPEVRRREAEGKLTSRDVFLLKLDSMGIAAPLATAYAALYPFLIIPQAFTYPPLPYIATPFLVFEAQTYDAVKFWGRLPSLVFTVITMGLIVAIASRLSSTTPWALALIMVAPLAFSREFTIMAAQMHSYAAAATAGAGVLLVTIMDASRSADRLGWRFGVGRGLLLASFCYLGYQVVFMLPGYFAAVGLVLLMQRPRRRSCFSVMWPVATAATISLLAILPVYFLRLRDAKTIHWNAGANSEFVFAPVGGWLSTIVEAGNFLAANTWLSIQGMVSPAPEASLPANGVTAVFLICTITGQTVLIRGMIKGKQSNGVTAMGIFSIVTLGSLFVLVLAGKLPLSPTRHLVAYLPLLAALSGWGFIQLVYSCSVSSDRSTALVCGMAGAWSAVIGMSFFWTYADFLAERKDPFNEAEIIALAKEHGAQVIIGYDWTDLTAMRALREDFPVAIMAPGGALIYYNQVPPASANFQRAILISHRSRFNEKLCRELISGNAAFHHSMIAECDEKGRVQLLVAKESPVEVEFSRRTHNGSNGLFISLVKFGS